MSDDGRPDPRLAAALQRWPDVPTAAARAEVLAALSGARVFLALAAQPTGTELSPVPGLEQERGAEMSLLSVVSSTGARALPAFTDGHVVQQWRAEARPVPVPGPQACSTALDDDADVLLLDPLGAAFAVTSQEMRALAEGQVPVPGSRLTTRYADHALRPLDEPPPRELLAALSAALELEAVTAARLLQGPDGLVLGVVPTGEASAARLAAMAERVAGRLGGALPAAGLDLAAVPLVGPGTEVPLRGRRRWRRRPR